MTTPSIEEQLRQQDRSTAQFRAIQMASNAIANLRVIGRINHDSDVSTPWRGSTVVICGAGPSLTDALPGLRDLTRASTQAVIVAVNTSLPALLAADVTPDVVVTIEGMPVSWQIRDFAARSRPEFVVDLLSHPDAVAMAAGRDNSTWIASGQPMLLGVLDAIGAVPTPYGSSATTAAFALAVSRGASQIILVGIDLCYRGDRAYADGTPWGGLRVEHVAGDRLRYTGTESRDELHDSAGIPRVPHERTEFRVPGQLGGEVWTTLEFEDQRRWFSAASSSVAYGTVWNASGGARIEGAIGLAPADIASQSRLPLAADRIRRPVPRPHAWEPYLRDECDRAEAMADAMLAGDGEKAVRLAARGMPFVEGVATGDIVGLQRTAMQARWKRRGIYEIWKAAARWTRDRIGEVAQ